MKWFDQVLSMLAVFALVMGGGGWAAHADPWAAALVVVSAITLVALWLSS